MPALHASLLAWYARARRDLPWRRTADPYAVWLSEVMLQQTRVETVVPYWHRFMASLPTVHALAEAPLEQVLTLWSGLGYYRRARMLHEGARQIARERRGEFPETAEALAAIEGIGPYTAGAVASIAFGQQAALVDGNVARVISRLFAVEEDVRRGPGLARIWAIARLLVSEEDPSSWNQALMELGALICVPRSPRCDECPALELCDARREGMETRLPVMAAKAKPLRARRAAIVATKGERVVLARRRVDGTFGGLWEPPMIDLGDGDEGGKGSFEALLGAPLLRFHGAGTVTHVLTHRRLEIDVFSGVLRGSPRSAGGPLYDALELVDPRAFGSRGLATLARKVLALAKVE